ncbi:MAG: hypothetical protein AAGL99_03095 [Pseudomonadota bacterium]
MFGTVDILGVLKDTLELEEVAAVSGAAAALPIIAKDKNSKQTKRNMVNPHPNSLEHLARLSRSFFAVWQWPWAFID